MRPDLYAPGSEYHQRRRWTHPHSVRCLQDAMKLLGTPASLLDVGCAEGVHVQWARERGVDAMGIDLAAPLGDPVFVRADLCEPVDLGRRFEWVICWEVAEHLPASAAETLCATLARHMAPTGRLIFTAAGLRQRGPGHIHCAELSYWRSLFAELGLQCADGLSDELRRRWLAVSPKTPWYGKNAAIFWRSA